MKPREEALLICALLVCVPPVAVNSSSGLDEPFIWPPNHDIAGVDLRNGSRVVQVSIVLPFSSGEVKGLQAVQSRAGSGVLTGFQTSASRGLLPANVAFNVTLRDSRCHNGWAPKVFIDSIVDGVNVVFGPSCDYALAPVARLIKFYNLPLLTAGGFTFDFSQPKTDPKSEYHLLTRTGFSYKTVVDLILEIFHKFSWNRTLLVYRKDDLASWSGAHTCKMIMSTFIEFAKNRAIEIGKVDIDLEYNKEYRQMIKNSLEDFAGWFIVIDSRTLLAFLSGSLA